MLDEMKRLRQVGSCARCPLGAALPAGHPSLSAGQLHTPPRLRPPPAPLPTSWPCAAAGDHWHRRRLRPRQADGAAGEGRCVAAIGSRHLPPPPSWQTPLILHPTAFIILRLLSGSQLPSFCSLFRRVSCVLVRSWFAGALLCRPSAHHCPLTFLSHSPIICSIPQCSKTSTTSSPRTGWWLTRGGSCWRCRRAAANAPLNGAHCGSVFRWPQARGSEPTSR